MKRQLFDVLFFDGMSQTIIGTSVQVVCRQVNKRMEYFDKTVPKENQQVDWRIQAVRWIKELEE